MKYWLNYSFNCDQKAKHSHRKKQVVKVIWHALPPRMVQSYSLRGTDVPSHVGTLAPPGEYARSFATIGPPEYTTQTANGLL